MFAYFSSGGNDAVPTGGEQLTIWFALPVLAIVASVLAIRQATRAADRGGGLLWTFVADGVAVTALVMWWLYGGSLTG